MSRSRQKKRICLFFVAGLIACLPHCNAAILAKGRLTKNETIVGNGGVKLIGMNISRPLSVEPREQSKLGLPNRSISSYFRPGAWKRNAEEMGFAAVVQSAFGGLKKWLAGSSHLETTAKREIAESESWAQWSNVVRLVSPRVAHWYSWQGGAARAPGGSSNTGFYTGRSGGPNSVGRQGSLQEAATEGGNRMPNQGPQRKEAFRVLSPPAAVRETDVSKQDRAGDTRQGVLNSSGRYSGASGSTGQAESSGSMSEGSENSRPRKAGSGSLAVNGVQGGEGWSAQMAARSPGGAGRVPAELPSVASNGGARGIFADRGRSKGPESGQDSISARGPPLQGSGGEGPEQLAARGAAGENSLASGVTQPQVEARREGESFRSSLPGTESVAEAVQGPIRQEERQEESGREVENRGAGSPSQVEARGEGGDGEGGEGEGGDGEVGEGEGGGGEGGEREGGEREGGEREGGEGALAAPNRNVEGGSGGGSGGEAGSSVGVGIGGSGSGSGVSNGDNTTQLAKMVYKLTKEGGHQSLAAAPCRTTLEWMPGVVAKLEFEMPEFKFYCVDTDEPRRSTSDLMAAFRLSSSALIMQVSPADTEHHFPKETDLVVSWMGMQQWGVRKAWRFIKGLRRSGAKMGLFGNNPKAKNSDAEEKLFLNVRRSPMLFNEPLRVISRVGSDESNPKQLLLYSMDSIRDGF